MNLLYYSDYHVHTHFSDDCTEKMHDMIKSAISLGLREIAFTDHVDFDYPDPQWPFVIDYEKYYEEFKMLKYEYSSSIDVLLGIEIGLQPHIKQDISALISSYPFDFVIGSVHAADRMDFCRDAFFKNKSQHECYMRYFENVLENINLYKGMFDVLGHMDLIVRYGGYESKILEYDMFSDIIDQILRLLISNGQGIEINTSGFRYGLGRVHPHPSIIKRYSQLGGKIITVGSDAHKKEDICADFDSAYDMIKDSGLTSICSFKSRKHSFIGI